MEKFIVSARKYRPGTFSSLIGQESIAATLKNAIKRDQLAHAYLFCGPRGVGKTSTARIFAKTINCLNPSPELEPCGECESCRSFAEGRSYCIHELDAASNNSVDDIRLLTEKVRIPPQVGKYSVYIIDEVHMLSAAAFNAFLKTLEEPPAHAIFILATTEKHKILPTILSRCQTYDFNRITIEEIVRNLNDIAGKEGIAVDPDSLHVIAQKADGAMRDALTLFDQTVAFCGSRITYDAVIRNLNVLDYEYYFRLTECSLTGNYSQSLLLFDEILSKGFNALYFISGLGTHFRNLIVCKEASTLRLLEMAPGAAERYKQQSVRCSFKFLYDALVLTTKCEAEYRGSNNQRLLVEFLLIRLAALMKMPPDATHSAPQTTRQEVPPEETQQTSAPLPRPAAGPGEPETLQKGLSSVQPAGENPPAPAPMPEVPAPSGTTAAGTAADETPANTPRTDEPKTGALRPDRTKRPKLGSLLKAEVSIGDNEPVPAGEADEPSSGLSIKNMLRGVRQQSAPAEEEVVREDLPITPERLSEAWARMGAGETQYPRLGTAIRQTVPELQEDGTTVHFYVSNSAQQSWIEKNSLLRLNKFLQDELGNSRLRLLIKVRDTAPQEKKLYMPHEKAEFLLKNNEELQELRKELDLDIK